MTQKTLFDGTGLSSPRGRLVRDIRYLADEVLPRRAEDTGSEDHREYPVEEDHCFRRIAYDAAAGRRWDEAVPPPFERHATRSQLRRARDALRAMARDANRARELNHRSLRYRGRSEQ